MLKTVLTQLGKQQLFRNPQIIVTQWRFFASFRSRDLQFENNEGAGSDTLATRLARYVTIKEVEGRDSIKYDISYSNFYPVGDIRMYMRDLEKVSTEQLTRMIVFTSVYKSRAEIPKMVDVINALDNECSKRVEDMTFERIVEFLNAFMYLLPNKLVQLDFYQLGIRKLLDDFNEKKTVKEFVEICFYLGMWKKNRFSTEKMTDLLRNYLVDFLPQLNNLDLAIVANAAFKTSSRSLSSDFCDRLVNEIVQMDTPDMSLLVTFVKSCRHNHVHSQKIIEKLREWFNNEELKYADIRAIGHFLSYLAECRIQDKQLVPNFVEKSFKMIGRQTRIKDISNFLWSCAHLGLDLDQNELNRLANIVFEKLDNEEYKYDSDDLVDTTLSLWMLNYKSPEMARAALQDFRGIRKNDSRVKLDSRRILLQTCLDLDGPTPKTMLKSNQGFSEDKPAETYLTIRRPNLKLAFSTLEKLKKELGLSSIRFVQQINELNIAGILCETKSGDKVHVEILDDSNTLSDKDTPFGLMKFKLNILQKRDCTVAVVSFFHVFISFSNWTNKFFFFKINATKISNEDEMLSVIKEKLQPFLEDDHSDNEQGTENLKI